MLKTKQKRFAVVAMLVFSLIAMYGGVPTVEAASMDSAKVTLSDSDMGATATSTVVFNLHTAINAGDYVKISYPAGFTGLVDDTKITCPDGGVASIVDNDAVCTGALAADANKTITVGGVVNPNPGTPTNYSIMVESYTSGDALVESTEVKVFIIDDVTVTAHVAATLTFAVTGVATTTTINGDATTGSTSPTEIAFKTLALDTEQRMAQELAVTTNASAGYTVTVQQDGNMVNGGGADIDAFNTAGPLPWASPAGTLGNETTYGHMGIASDDSNLGTAFADGSYRGLDGTTPLEVMSHNGSADGSTQDIGKASVMYNIEITDLQEAGDYKNTLTYVCTPTF